MMEMLTPGAVAIDDETRELTPTPTSQRHKFFVENEGDNVSTVDHDDSGNYSSSSNISDDLELQGNCVRYQNLLQEKEKSLFLAIQDVRKLRSELERLSKSEQWYKQELRQQKSTRLEALERLYTQERKYMQENQRLQRECVRLYAKCAEMEQDLEAQKQKTLRELKSGREVDLQQTSDQDTSQFEIEQQQALIIDQQQLIAVLRKQKRALLEDLQRLTEEKDEKVMELQRAIAGLELENNHITSKCKQLLDERQHLKQKLQSKAEKTMEETAEREKLHKIIGDLREQLSGQETLLTQREGEILELQSKFKANLHAETNVDEVHRLSIVYHEEINAKTLEIRLLKTSLLQLQEELASLGNLQAQNDQQERLIENLNFTLETRQCELQNLQQTDVSKTQQIAELQLNLESCLLERETNQLQLADAQTKIKSVEGELIALHDKYASMCALCERTKFELELREIEQNKLKFQTEADRSDIEQLREKLKVYLQKTTELSGKIAALEAELDRKSSEKAELKLQLSTANPHNNNPENTAYAEALHTKLLEKEQIIVQLQQVNKSLKEQQQTETLLERHSLTNAEKEPETSSTVVQNAEQERTNIKELQAESIEKEEKCETKINAESMSELVNKNTDFKSSEIEKERIYQLQQNLQQKTEECAKLTDELRDKDENVRNLQLNLLKIDAKLYKHQKAEEKRKYETTAHTLENAAASDALQKEYTIACDELKMLQEDKLKLEVELSAEKTNVKALNEKLIRVGEIKTYAEQEIQTDPSPLHDMQEQSTTDSVEQRAERVKLLQQLLQQQDDRVKQLNEAQQEWEELLDVLTATQKLEEQNRHELALKREELEELNNLFAEQNEELQQLQHHNYHMEQQRHADTERMQNTFQMQLSDLTAQLEEKETESAEQQNTIANLQQTNSRLQQRLNEEYADTVATHNQQLRTLRTKVAKMQQEREESTLRLQEMECEITELKRSKEQVTSRLPPELHFYRESSSEADTEELLSVSSESGVDEVNSTQDRVKILTRVLEAEYKRKMKRYDLHIHTLLGNVKALKRALKTAEQKTAVLNAEKRSNLVRAEDLQLTKMHLEEMRLKYEQSQATVKALEQQLTMERKRYDASDLGKSTNSAQITLEATHEVANLIDDYKKLIKQSAASTQRLKTSAILELIQRSNQCVPNLNKLETSVADLHNDVQQFLTAYSQQQNIQQQSSVFPFVGVCAKRPSLLDELRAAEQF